MTKQKVRDFAAWATSRVKTEEPNSKLKYALDKMLLRVRPILVGINEAWEDIDLDLAHTDEKGILIRDQSGAYTYTKENEKERIAKRRAVMKETVTIKPFIVDHAEYELSEVDLEFGNGFVFNVSEDGNET